MERVIPLKEPLTVTFTGPDGERQETISEVKIRTNVKARDLRCMDRVSGDIAKTMELIAQLSNLSIKQIDDLSAEDFSAVGEAVGEFVGSGRKTGATD